MSPLGWGDAPDLPDSSRGAIVTTRRWNSECPTSVTGPISRLRRDGIPAPDAALESRVASNSGPLLACRGAEPPPNLRIGGARIRPLSRFGNAGSSSMGAQRTSGSAPQASTRRMYGFVNSGSLETRTLLPSGNPVPPPSSPSSSLGEKGCASRHSCYFRGKDWGGTRSCYRDNRRGSPAWTAGARVGLPWSPKRF